MPKRSKFGGTLVYREDRQCWQASIDMPRGLDGKRNRPVFYGTQEECETWLIEKQYEKQNSIYVVGKDATLENYLKEWHKTYNEKKAETTKELYEMYINVHIVPAIGHMKLRDILGFHIQEFYNKLGKTLSDNTILKIHSLLNRAFKDAVRNKFIRDNPCEAVNLPKKTTPKYVILKEEEVIKLLTITNGTVDEIFIMLAALVGLRRGEICGLKWQDIDFENQTITIVRTKTRFKKNVEKKPKSEASIRTIKAPKVVFDTLKKYRAELGIHHEYVTPQYKPQSYSYHFRKLLEKNNFPPFRFHDLRHFNATIMLKAGVPDKVASKRLGHSQVQTTREIYQHVLEDMDKSAADVIEKEIFKAIF